MEPARLALTTVLGDLLRATPVPERPLYTWPMVCGKAVAARTTAVSCRDGFLRILVPDGSWRSQLAELEAQYLREFARLLGRDAVQHIQFVESWKE